MHNMQISAYAGPGRGPALPHKPWHFHIHKRPQKGCLWGVILFLEKEIRFFVEVPGTRYRPKGEYPSTIETICSFILS